MGKAQWRAWLWLQGAWSSAPSPPPRCPPPCCPPPKPGATHHILQPMGHLVFLFFPPLLPAFKAMTFKLFVFHHNPQVNFMS